MAIQSPTAARLKTDFSGMREVSRFYALPENTPVLGMLTRNPDLIPLLLEARGKIRGYFGDAPVSLKLSIPDEGENIEKLVATVGTHLEPDEALNLLDRFDDEWWLDASETAEERLCVRVTYI